MTIKIRVGDKTEDSKHEPTRMELAIRKTIDGNIMLFDHNEMDIVIIPESNKVIAFSKNNFNDSVYAAQDRFFRYLAMKGALNRESIRSGNVYGSLEAEYPLSEDVNSLQLVLFTIGKFIEEEKPHMEKEKYLEDEHEERLTNPDEEESTELGEIPQKATKGSLPKDANMYKTRRWYAPGA